MLEFGEGLRKLNRLRPTGALADFTKQVEGVLDFVYDTQMEYAACTPETGSCVVMDGNDDMSYKLLGNFARGEEIYSMEEVAADRYTLVYNPSKIHEDPQLVQQVGLPVLAIDMGDLEAL